MNTTKTLISTAIAIALTVSQSSYAKTDLDKTKSSVFTWGPWAGQVITAAGGNLIDVQAVIPPDQSGQLRSGDFDDLDPKLDKPSGAYEQYRGYATCTLVLTQSEIAELQLQL